MSRVHWVKKTHLFRPDEYICTGCGVVSDTPYKVCPNCGAVMGRTKVEASWVDEAEGLSAILDDDW